MNTFGHRLRFSIFGESHGRGVGCVLDGLPPGMPLELERVQAALARRAPGQSRHTSQRREPDELEVLAGELGGRCTGAPLALWIANRDARGKDYEAIQDVPRPGHADWTAHVRSGGWNDPRGGGHFSGRLTAALVAAGAVAQTLLTAHGIEAAAHLQQVGDLAGPAGVCDVAAMRAAAGEALPSAHRDHIAAWEGMLDSVRKAGDSLGGVIELRAEGLPVGVGEPWTSSVESHLAQLLFAIPAVKGVSFGAGFAAAAMRGSQHNDPYAVDKVGNIHPVTNHAGGVLGGLTTGAPLLGHVAVKPTSSIFQPQQSVRLSTREPAILDLKGRHDPCIALRAVPAVAAAAALALADLLLSWLAAEHARAPWPRSQPDTSP